MTPEQIELARHALGLPNDKRRSYRNRFIAGPGHRDYPAWVQMITDGNALRYTRAGFAAGADLFVLTAVGAVAALQPNERLDQEDFPGVRK